MVSFYLLNVCDFRLAGTQAGVYHQQIDLSGMMCYLCEEIDTGVTQLLQSAPPANDQDEMVSYSDGRQGEGGKQRGL